MPFFQGVKAVTSQLEQNALAGPYRAPVKLRKRAELSGFSDGESVAKTVAANESATGLQLHKDSKWFQSWESFKNDNAYVNKLFEFKMKYDESENPVVRSARALTDKITDLMGKLIAVENYTPVRANPDGRVSYFERCFFSDIYLCESSSRYYSLPQFFRWAV